MNIRAKLESGFTPVNLKWKSTGLTRPLCRDEIAAAKTVFGNRIDYSGVTVVDGKFIPLHRKRWIIAPNGHIYWPGECGNLATGQLSRHVGTLIHEMTHVMQFQRGQKVLLRGLFLHTARVLTCGWYNPYRVKYMPGKPFHAYNLEQQAELARQIYFRLLPNIILGSAEYYRVRRPEAAASGHKSQ